jgi:PAS domain S-box-containing protein
MPAAHSRLAPSSDADPLRVLLIESRRADPQLRRALTLQTRSTRFSLECVTGFSAGMDAIRRRAHDVCLLDSRLDEGSGLKLVAEARSGGVDAAMIVLVSSLSEAETLTTSEPDVSDWLVRRDLSADLVSRVILHAVERKSLGRAQDETRAALQQTESRFRLILDSTGEGIYGLDLTGACTFVNPAAARMLGYEHASELIGKKIHDLGHHSFKDGRSYPHAACPIYGAYLRGEGVHVADEVFWRADGSNFPVEYWSYPIREHDAVVGAVVTFVDITERLHTQATLARSESRFRRIVEASFDAIVIHEHGVIVEANHGFAQLFGWTPDAIVGRSALDFVADESVDLVTRRIACGTEGKYDLVGKRSDGTTMFLEAIGRAHHVVNGTTERITALRDVTERRQIEARLHQGHRMEAMGRLAGGVAHDFNNLLTVISGCTDLLIEGLAPNDPRGEDLGAIKRAARAAAALTRQLLTFSRQQPITPQLVDLDAAVGNAQALIGRLVGLDVTVRTVLHGASTVRIDPCQLDQVLINLAVNARDAMSARGVLTIETARADADEVPCSKTPNDTEARVSYVRLSVSDTGTGMDETTQARIFEPFFTTKPLGKGTGLGLSTVFGIVNQNAGYVRVRSQRDAGSTFDVYLPCALDDGWSAGTGAGSEWRADPTA